MWLGQKAQALLRVATRSLVTHREGFDIVPLLSLLRARHLRINKRAQAHRLQNFVSSECAQAMKREIAPNIADSTQKPIRLLRILIARTGSLPMTVGGLCQRARTVLGHARISGVSWQTEDGSERQNAVSFEIEP